MRYNPPEETRQESDEEQQVYFEGRPRYVSDQTAFMRWSTELEQSNELVDPEFLKTNKYRVMDINKFLPLSFIKNPRNIPLFRLRRMNMTHEKDAGLFENAAETVLDNLADYQTTRGINGNFQKALITQRREWQDKTEPETKKGIMGRLIKGKSEEQRGMEMQEVYQQ